MKRRTLVQGAAAGALGFPHLVGFAQQSITPVHTFSAPLSNVWLSMHKPWMDKVGKDPAGASVRGLPGHAARRHVASQLNDQARDGVVDIVDAARQHGGPLSSHRGFRAAVHDEQRRGHVQGLLGVRARRMRRTSSRTRTSSRQVHGPGNVPFRQADQERGDLKGTEQCAAPRSR
ncbi:MAG: hypothetical protein IPP44_30770 [Ideonella sp.]|nr:hypothetical protein [Ideonella sp.]